MPFVASLDRLDYPSISSYSSSSSFKKGFSERERRHRSELWDYSKLISWALFFRLYKKEDGNLALHLGADVRAQGRSWIGFFFFFFFSFFAGVLQEPRSVSAD